MITLKQAAAQTREILYPAEGPPVARTVAEEWAAAFAPMAEIRALPKGKSVGGQHRFVVDASQGNIRAGASDAWMSLALDETGTGRLSSSHPHWLYALFCRACEEWSEVVVTEFSPPKVVRPKFRWLRNLSDFLVGSLRNSRHLDRVGYFRQLARAGFSHATINGLGVPRPFETSPPGDLYYWFYDYSPDLDQFVDSSLLRGYYPPDYLRANVTFLKHNAALAQRYGLTPGLHINSPRSMPEEFWNRYGFLRGARVDHPRETRRPRYTLAMAHPIVQEHYRELMRNILREVPEIEFIHLWTNDSGSGFEFVSTLYAGRNGGPYLLREWKNDEEIARAAAGNVLTYYRLLLEEGQKVNPAFRLVCDLGPFSAERRYIIPSLGKGMDAGEFAYFESPRAEEDHRMLADVGAEVHVKLDLHDNNVPGVPYPRLVWERLQQAHTETHDFILTGANPQSLVPYDINGEVARAYQLGTCSSVDEVMEAAARRWVGTPRSDALFGLWNFSDTAVRAFPPDIPMSTFGFPWFRLWVRPFVPNIDAIPEVDRQYYEDFLLATFNNPARIDLNNDMMWSFLSVEQAGERKRMIDEKVLPPLSEAIQLAQQILTDAMVPGDTRRAFLDQHDRLLAYRCYCTTMRNTVAWTEAVHGYMQGPTADARSRYRTLCQEMVRSEKHNAQALLDLWEMSNVDFMPVSVVGESLHTYGANFGDLVRRKIALMDQHADDEPYIDPAYMWRMPCADQKHSG